MKNALISPNEQAQYVSAWELKGTEYVPVFTTCGERVAEVSQTTFEVAKPLFWVECDDVVTPEAYCYADNVCTAIPADAPMPTPENQANVSGAQVL